MLRNYINCEVKKSPRKEKVVLNRRRLFSEFFKRCKDGNYFGIKKSNIN